MNNAVGTVYLLRTVNNAPTAVWCNLSDYTPETDTLCNDKADVLRAAGPVVETFEFYTVEGNLQVLGAIKLGEAGPEVIVPPVPIYSVAKFADSWFVIDGLGAKLPGQPAPGYKTEALAIAAIPAA